MTTNHSNDFWRWSLDHYTRDGVEKQLIELQDEFDFNVNIVLWCCWCAENFDAPPEFAIRKAIDLTQEWDSEIVIPLRRVRRRLKALTASDELPANLRETVKQAELGAEKYQQSQLHKLARQALSPVTPNTDPRAQARRQIAAYAALIGAQKKPRFTVSMIDNLVERIYAPASSSGIAAPKTNKAKTEKAGANNV